LLNLPSPVLAEDVVTFYSGFGGGLGIPFGVLGEERKSSPFFAVSFEGIFRDFLDFGMRIPVFASFKSKEAENSLTIIGFPSMFIGVISQDKVEGFSAYIRIIFDQYFLAGKRMLLGREGISGQVGFPISILERLDIEPQIGYTLIFMGKDGFRQILYPAISVRILSIP
jgi:hypothetical protein